MLSLATRLRRTVLRTGSPDYQSNPASREREGCPLQRAFGATRLQRRALARWADKQYKSYLKGIGLNPSLAQRTLSALRQLFRSEATWAFPALVFVTLPPEQPIHLGRFPALSPDGKSICFSYQGNLWVSPVKGGPATRLTAKTTPTTEHRFPPDARKNGLI